MVKLAHWWIAHARPKGPGQRRHIVASTNVSPFAWARNICCGHKFCIRDRKDVSDSVQEHFVCGTNVSQFAQHGNTQNSFSVARLRPEETSWATMCPQYCALVCQGLESLREEWEKANWHFRAPLFLDSSSLNFVLFYLFSYYKLNGTIAYYIKFLLCCEYEY